MQKNEICKWLDLAEVDFMRFCLLRPDQLYPANTTPTYPTPKTWRSTRSRSGWIVFASSKAPAKAAALPYTGPAVLCRCGELVPWCKRVRWGHALAPHDCRFTPAARRLRTGEEKA